MTKTKIITLALVAVIAVMAIAGASIAYFTDTKTASNTITMGNVRIVLDEAPVDAEGKATGGNRVTANEYGIGAAYPGAVLEKDPTVHNTGSNPAYIRATVNVSNWMNLVAAYYPEFEATFPNDGYKAALSLLVGELGDGWSVVDVEAGDTFTVGQFDAKFVLKYDSVIAPGEDTSPMFRQVLIPAGIDNANAASFNEIKIVAQAVQENGFDTWEAAFSAFDGS